MNSISVIIGNNTKYSIELKDEYKSEEFINFFTEQMQIIKKIIPTPVNIPIPEDTPFTRNVLFDKLDIMVRGLGKDIETKDGDSMRSYKSRIKSKNKPMGLAWLKPTGNSLLVYLQSRDFTMNKKDINYSEIDRNKKIVYSKPKKTTFGNYPYLKINNESELEYALRIIKYAYSLGLN